MACSSESTRSELVAGTFSQCLQLGVPVRQGVARARSDSSPKDER